MVRVLRQCRHIDLLKACLTTLVSDRSTTEIEISFSDAQVYRKCRCRL